jgi:hypothetical protein
VVDALAGASAMLVDEHVLDAVEPLLANQRLVPAGFALSREVG